MIYVLLISFIIAFILYYIVAQSFNSPVSLILLSFIMSLSLIMANIENWQVHLHKDFPIYILTAVTSFAAGCFLIKVISEKRQTGTVPENNIADTQGLSGAGSLIVFVALPGVCTVIYLLLSLGIGVGDNANILRNIYEYSVANSSNFILHQMREIIVAAAEVDMIYIFSSRYYNKIKISITALVPLACYAICTLLSTDRNIFLRFIIYSLSLWIFYLRGTSEKSIKAVNRQIVGRASAVVAAAVGSFYLLGKIKSYTSDFERMIGIYGGSGLYNFNLFIDRFKDYDPEYGKETFSQLFSTLRTLGINIGGYTQNTIGREMIVFRSANGYTYASNIYSAMMPYVTDFGLAGVIVFPFAMGCILSILYETGIKKQSSYLWGVYSMLVYAAVYFSIVEQFFYRLHLGLFYELFWFTAVYAAAFKVNWRKPSSF